MMLSWKLPMKRTRNQAMQPITPTVRSGSTTSSNTESVFASTMRAAKLKPMIQASTLRGLRAADRRGKSHSIIVLRECSSSRIMVRRRKKFATTTASTTRNSCSTSVSMFSPPVSPARKVWNQEK